MNGLAVTILGAGTAVPTLGRFPAGVLVAGGGARILIDCGPGVLRRLPEVGIGLEQIDAVLLTHRHLDHNADLAALLFALQNPRYEGRKPLHVRGAAWLTEYLAGIRAAWPKWTEPRGYELDVATIGAGAFELCGLTITAVPVTHSEGSLAYRIEHAGRSVAVSGDADALDGLADVARGVDVFVCEAAVPESERRGRHLSAELAGRAAREAGCKTLCLTHLYPECTGLPSADLAAEAFPGEIVVARDLLRFDLAPLRSDGPQGLEVSLPPRLRRS